MTLCRHFILEACEVMCRNKHCAAASEFLFLQLLKDFLQVFFSAHYLKVSWLTVTRFSWYVTLPEDMSFSELPLQKDAPQSPGMPIKPTSCFAALLLQSLRLLVWLPLLVTHLPCLWLFSTSRFWTISKFLASRHRWVTDLVVTAVPSPMTCALPEVSAFVVASPDC